MSKGLKVKNVELRGSNTFASMGVASFSGLPGQVMIEVLASLTVQPLGVVVAHTVAMNLQSQNRKSQDI